MPVVVNTTVLTNLAAVGRADLVQRVWGDACWTTPDVLAELQSGVAQGLFEADLWRGLPVVELTHNEAALAASLSSGLGPGERSCLAVALNRGARFASDDRTARGLALRRGLEVTGTLGLLLDAVRQRELDVTEGNALLGGMISRG